MISRDRRSQWVGEAGGDQRKSTWKYGVLSGGLHEIRGDQGWAGSSSVQPDMIGTGGIRAKV